MEGICQDGTRIHESLRRRWEVLGINALSDGSKKGKEKATEDEISDPGPLLEEVDIVMGSTPGIKDVAVTDTVEGAEGRRQIMKGAIVKSVIR